MLASKDDRVTVLMKSGGHFDFNPECLHRGAVEFFKKGDLVQIREDMSLGDMKKDQEIDDRWAPIIGEVSSRLFDINVCLF